MAKKSKPAKPSSAEKSKPSSADIWRMVNADEPVRRLEGVGRVLFGPHWKEPLAAALGVARNTVFNWAAKPDTIPADIDYRLAEVAERGAEAHREDMRRVERLIADTVGALRKRIKA